MGLFSRLGSLLKANINDLISRAEDPEKILNQLILDMRDQLVAAKKHVAVAIADEKRLKKELDNNLHMASEWEKKAMMAIRAGKDALAKEALARKTEYDNLASEFQKQWEIQKAGADKLRTALHALNNKIEEAKRKKNLLIARQKRAIAQEQIHKTMASLADNDAFSAFDRMKEKIEKQEAEAEAAEELADQNYDLENKFKDLESNEGADDALAALKAKMGLTSGSSAASSSPRPSIPDSEWDELEATSTKTSSANKKTTGGRWDREDF
jgi:phage shock protein A